MRHLLSCLLVCAACGGTSGTSLNGSASGNVEGKSLTANDALAVVAKVKDNANNVQLARIAIVDKPGICEAARKGNQPGNVSALVLEIRNESLSSEPPAIAPGTYLIGTEIKKAESSYFEKTSASFAVTDGQCRNTIKEGTASSGRITIDSITSTNVKGSYSVRIGSGALNGTFDVPLCDVPIPTEVSCSG